MPRAGSSCSWSTISARDASTGTRNSSAKEDAVEAVLALIADRDLAGKVTNQRLAIRKLRGGRTGHEIAFQPRLVVLDEGGAVSTLVVDWSEADGADKPRRREWPKVVRIFLKALDFVVAAKREMVRTEFVKDLPRRQAESEGHLRCELSAIAGNLMGLTSPGPDRASTTYF
jgi:hypothetical protein